MPQLCVHIRWMIRRDMAEVFRIERDSFEFAWTEEDFLEALRKRNYIGMVAEADDRIVGFMVYALHKAHLQVVNFAVHPDYRRRGVGAQLVAKMRSKLHAYRRTELTLAVRESNLAAQLFFRKTGFKAAEVLRGHYEDSGEDAYSMWLGLQDRDPRPHSRLRLSQ